MDLKEINIIPVDVGFTKGLMGGMGSGKEVQGVFPIIYPKPVGGDAAAKNSNGMIGVGPGFVGAGQDHRGRAITDRGGVIEAKRG